MISDTAKREFRETVWGYYQAHGRHELPWRLPDANGRFDPYRIMVSELMLQQTQVSRVIPKYLEFLQRFPTVEDLAKAPLGAVLRAWNGLGYNRRAKFLHEAARQIIHDHQEQFPDSMSELMRLPGIGIGTAGAIMAYAFNQPVMFVETNIRTVFIHHFFHDGDDIADAEITQLVEATLPEQNGGHYREWYWALTDYGVHLKQSIGNLNRRSRTYVKQSKFEGSQRQLRGQIIKLLAERPQTADELQALISDQRLPAVLSELTAEKLIVKRRERFSL